MFCHFLRYALPRRRRSLVMCLVYLCSDLVSIVNNKCCRSYCFPTLWPHFPTPPPPRPHFSQFIIISFTHESLSEHLSASVSETCSSCRVLLRNPAGFLWTLHRDTCRAASIEAVRLFSSAPVCSHLDAPGSSTLLIRLSGWSMMLCCDSFVLGISPGMAASCVYVKGFLHCRDLSSVYCNYSEIFQCL